MYITIKIRIYKNNKEDAELIKKKKREEKRNNLK